MRELARLFYCIYLDIINKVKRKSMSRCRNLSLALLVHRCRWLVIANSACSSLAVLCSVTCLVLCLLRLPVNSPRDRYRACVVFEVNLIYKGPVRVHPCSQNWTWPLLSTSADVPVEMNTQIRLPGKWSALHFLGPTFPTRVAGWHYVPLANVSSMRCLLPCKTVRPPFRGYTFKPSSALPFL